MSEEKSQFNLPSEEEKILKFWEENQVFAKSLAQNRRKKPFVFYEGPPTANNLPHIGHSLTRAFKDAVLRYKTMRGFYVARRAGWDTHGLPVEIEVEKKLGLKSKRDIEKYGIAKFNQKAKASVWDYKNEWERSTERLGFWLDLKNPYITYQTSYIEVLWGIIKEFWRKNLLYEEFKVLPWCPRCGTGLSSHEVAEGYKKVREDSVYVKLKLKRDKNEYLLIWTTTPWTLPANVAVALDPGLEYTKYKVGNEFIWSATSPPAREGFEIEAVEKVSGKSLLNLKYEPLFKVPERYSLGSSPEFKTIAGDFVSAEEGTGMVHLAPAFGEEDMEAVRKEYKDNYPILYTVNSDGTMKNGLVGEGRFVKEADKLIITELKRRNLLYALKPYEHEYPHCWRCGTPLLYFARKSWWVRVTKVKKYLLKNNESINWIPAHIKYGRFGEFLKDARDWAFSRERFWGTPLPVWKCGKCGKEEVVESKEELAQRAEAPKNQYFIMRHGEALSNLKNTISYAVNSRLGLTLRGRIQTEKSARRLKKTKIDLIFSSDVLRTKETAEIVAGVLGLKKINFDKRLREINTGVFEGRRPQEYHAYFSSPLEKFTKKPPGGENLTELRKRVMSFLFDLERRYSGKTILIISHEYPLWMLYAGALGLSNEESLALRKGKRKKDFIGYAEPKRLVYKKVPRDENYEVNLHRPYVDVFYFPCRDCGFDMKRVPDVVDVWFDSGSMPWASQARGSWREIKNYPADFICEGVDQTRGWFYTLLAVATLLGEVAPYKNVISLGHVLDKNGQKMSKSKGNVVNPAEMVKKYGADTLRWFFYTVNPPGEPKRFDEKELFVKLRGFLMIFWNTFLFFDTYADTIRNQRLKVKNYRLHILDQWIFLKLEELAREVTKKFDKYDLTGAARSIENFIVNDFSQWYLRRSRRRFQKPNSRQEKNYASFTTAWALLILTKLSAPFIPFLAEKIYQGLRRKLKLRKFSIHLEKWPTIPSRDTAFGQGLGGTFRGKSAKSVLNLMEEVRSIVSEALKLRARAGIKVRQPLLKLKIRNERLKGSEWQDLIREEVNVKEVTIDKTLKEEVWLDTTITPELKEEGLVREFVRNVQEMRKSLGLKPKDVVRCQISGARNLEEIFEKWKQTILRETNSSELKIGGKKVFKAERKFKIEGTELWVGLDI